MRRTDSHGAAAYIWGFPLYGTASGFGWVLGPALSSGSAPKLAHPSRPDWTGSHGDDSASSSDKLYSGVGTLSPTASIQ